MKKGEETVSGREGKKGVPVLTKMAARNKIGPISARRNP